MSDVFNRLTQLAEHAIGGLKVSSALNGALWLCGICIPFGLIVATFSTGAVQIVALGLAVAPVLLVIFAYLYFMFKSPDKLRSEEYELRRFALSLIEEKGGAIPLAESSIQAIANPDYKAPPKLLPGGE